MTTKEVYNALVRMPNLHSVPQLFDNILVWHLYENAYVQAFCQDDDASIDIVSTSLFSGSLMHWHPAPDDLVQELYALGKKGNMLVLKKTLLCTSIFYSGPSGSSPLPERETVSFSRKKWDSGQLVYLDQK